MRIPFWVVILICSTARAEPPVDKPGLVVLTPKVSGEQPDEVDVLALGNLVSSLIAEVGEHQVITQEDVVAVLEQAGKSMMLGCDETACMAEIGAAMGAPFLFTFNVGWVAGSYVVTGSLIDNRDAKVLQRQSVTVASSDQLLDACRVVTLRVFGRDAELATAHSWRLFAWSALAVGAAATVTGAVATGLGAHWQSRAETTDSRDEFDTLRGRVSTSNAVAVTGYVTGGVLLAAAAVFFLLPDHSVQAGQTTEVEVSWQVRPLGTGGAYVQTSFAF